MEVSLPVDADLVVGLLGHVAVLFSSFGGSFTRFSTVAAPVHEGSLFSASSAAFLSCLSKHRHPNRCELVSPCGFGLHLPDD